MKTRSAFDSGPRNGVKVTLPEAVGVLLDLLVDRLGPQVANEVVRTMERPVLARPARLLRIDEVLQLVGFGRTVWDELVRYEIAPPPCGTHQWSEHAIERFVRGVESGSIDVSPRGREIARRRVQSKKRRAS